MFVMLLSALVSFSHLFYCFLLLFSVGHHVIPLTLFRECVPFSPSLSVYHTYCLSFCLSLKLPLFLYFYLFLSISLSMFIYLSIFLSLSLFFLLSFHSFLSFFPFLSCVQLPASYAAHYYAILYQTAFNCTNFISEQLNPLTCLNVHFFCFALLCCAVLCCAVLCCAVIC